MCSTQIFSGPLANGNRPLSHGAMLSLRRIKKLFVFGQFSPRHEFSVRLAIQKQRFLFF